MLQERARTNGRKIDPLRIKYNLACTVGTGTAFLGTWLGAHITEALTGSRMAAATVGSLALSLAFGVGGFALSWMAIRLKDYAKKPELLKETRKLAGKNFLAAIPSIASRVPVSAAAVLLGMGSEASGILGFLVAQVVFYTGANLLTRKDFGEKPKE